MRRALVFIEVLNCRECPLHQPAPNDKSELVAYCSVVGKFVANIDTVPNWCPFLFEDNETERMIVRQ